MECRGLRGCETGDAKITRGYRLPASYVIHTVGPVWQGGDHGEPALLESCYRRSIDLCRAHDLGSVAFPAISTGVYRFPADNAANIAVATTVHAADAVASLTHVIFCCFSDTSALLHEKALASVVVSGDDL
jgi:O-acetyl-ADP-ribose deacetylase